MPAAASRAPRGSGMLLLSLCLLLGCPSPAWAVSSTPLDRGGDPATPLAERPEVVAPAERDARPPDGPGALPADSLIAWPPDWVCGHLRHVTVETASIFRRGEQEGEYFHARLANALHFKTRPEVVRRGLYLRRGQRVCRDDLEAALRRLRNYGFLHGDVRIGIAADADSIDLVVRTRDVWSTRPAVKFGKQGSLWTWAARLEETNLLGLGKQFMVEVGHDERESFWGWAYGDPQWFGRDLALGLSMARGAELRSEGLLVRRPFARPTTPWGMRLDAWRYEGKRIDRRGGVNGPEWTTKAWLALARAGPRVAGGARRALRILPTFYWASETYQPPDSTSPATAGGPCARRIAGEPLRDRERRAVGLTLDWVREAYVRRRGVDLLDAWEDINLGTQAQALLAYSLRRWGAERDAGYLQLDLEQGLDPGRRGLARLLVRGYGEVGAGGIGDALLVLLLRGYAALSNRQTLALRLEADLSRGLAPQDLPTLGAEHGLRGFDAYRFWGEHACGASLENRVRLVEDVLGVLSLGGVVFLEAGTTWSRGCASEAKGRACAGVGLRVQGSRTSGRFVTRLDLGHPLAGAEEGDGWVASVALGQAF